MHARRRFAVGALAVAALALGHALATWPPRRTAVLFVGGALLAFAAEAAVVRLGLLRHHTGPRVAGVPVPVVLAWPAVVYVAYRLATLVAAPGVPAAALAAVAATAFDAATDARGVAAGHWSYPEAAVSRPRLRGVPWWNYAGWLAVVFVTALLPTAVG